MSLQTVVVTDTAVLVADTSAADLTNLRETAIPAGWGGSTAGAVSPNGKWVAIGDNTANEVAIYPFSEAGVGAPVLTSITGNVQPFGLAFAKHDPSLLAVLTLVNGLQIFRVSDAGALTLLDSIATSGGGSGVDWNDSGDRIVAGKSNTVLGLYSWSGTAIAELATQSISRSQNIHYIRGAEKVVTGQGVNDLLNIFDVSSDSFSSLASTSFEMSDRSGLDVSRNGALLFAGNRTPEALARLFDISENSFSEVATFPREERHAAWLQNNRNIVGVNVTTTVETNVKLHLYAWDGSALTTVAGPLVAADGGEIKAVDIYGKIGPETSQELFKASYADASAADYKITALVSPVDVQRSIDTDVTNLLRNPKEYVLEGRVGLGERHLFRPGALFELRHDQPGLRAGKKLLLKRIAARSANPAVPCTCIFWG